MKNAIFVIFLFASGFQSPDPMWEKTSVSEGVETKIGTDPKTGFPIFESTVTINGNIKTIFGKLTDHDRLEELVYGVSDSKRLPDDEGRVVVYYQLDLPWPVRDKYAVTQEVSTIQENRIDILVKSFNSEYEPEENLSKIDMLLTNWELYQIDATTTKVVYRSTADPMRVPNWIVKWFLSTSPRETLFNLRSVVESR